MSINMFVTLNVHKSAEGNCYYYDLPNGERLIIQGGVIEGIYDPNLDKVLE